MLEIISVIVFIVCAGGSFISFCLLRKKKEKPKKSESAGKDIRRKCK